MITSTASHKLIAWQLLSHPQAYVEFKRNYRAVMRVHKEAIQTQRDFWKMLMHSTAKMASIQHKLQEVRACDF